MKTSGDVLRQIAEKLLEFKVVVRVEFLKTKVRAYLVNDYGLDIYYNIILGKYSYTVFKSKRRIIGWDNAPHHRNVVETYPHHFHDINGHIKPSDLSGDPIRDLNQIMKIISQKILSKK